MYKYRACENLVRLNFFRNMEVVIACWYPSLFLLLRIAFRKKTFFWRFSLQRCTVVNLKKVKYVIAETVSFVDRIQTAMYSWVIPQGTTFCLLHGITGLQYTVVSTAPD